MGFIVDNSWMWSTRPEDLYEEKMFDVLGDSFLNSDNTSKTECKFHLNFYRYLPENITERVNDVIMNSPPQNIVPNTDSSENGLFCTVLCFKTIIVCHLYNVCH